MLGTLMGNMELCTPAYHSPPAVWPSSKQPVDGTSLGPRGWGLLIEEALKLSRTMDIFFYYWKARFLTTDF